MANRYSAKLLFYYDVAQQSTIAQFEERIVTFEARGPKEAIARARRMGNKAEYVFKNAAGSDTAFQFLGIADMIKLGVECSDEEVWYDVYRMKTSKADSRIQPDHQLLDRIRV
ncbi:DUF4288 domain-containing protein [Aeoliella mucimassa]|uniref:DUF4288 domain-containing protein n=1 Tax=Aeoliella mucimassa TaxID=2527972 RepID=A0A518AI91_9BACT|nr:DUF4288 domain-containing protein [Aeoliella mucimassa]QDU54436.1 hypothetical protein Pan181_06170 [Aeoliella mucimassa]